MYISRALFPVLTVVAISGNICFGQVSDLYLRNINITTPDSVIKATAVYDTKKQNLQPEINYYWYDAGQINHNRGGYTGKPLHGKYEVFDNQQKLRVSGFFEYGVMSERWTRWYPNGNIQVTGTYKNGVLHGEVKRFGIDGKPELILNYKNGLLQGKSYFFQPDTVIVRRYKDGKEVIRENKSVKQTESKKGPDQQVNTLSSQQNGQKTDIQPKKKWWQLSFLKRKEKKEPDTQVNNTTTSQPNKIAGPDKTKKPWWKFSFLKKKQTTNETKN